VCAIGHVVHIEKDIPTPPDTNHTVRMTDHVEIVLEQVLKGEPPGTAFTLEDTLSTPLKRREITEGADGKPDTLWLVVSHTGGDLGLRPIEGMRYVHFSTADGRRPGLPVITTDAAGIPRVRMAGDRYSP
jgi:hypothetical protein